jgi:hypothetical protein
LGEEFKIAYPFPWRRRNRAEHPTCHAGLILN